MSLADELAALTAASQTFDQKFAVKLAAKVRETKLADNALALSDYTPAQVQTSLRGPLDVHVAQPGAHGITAAQVGAVPKATLDAQLANMPRLLDMPLSRFGDLGYLPAGVGGSFEGASTNDVFRNIYMFLENDGTLVYLRNGINGSKQGVYYAHLKAALVPGRPAQPIKTNRRYQPAYFPVGQTAAYLTAGHSNPTVLVGRLQNVSGALQNYFVSLTNGTLDDTVHTGGFITPAVWDSLGLGRGAAFISDGQVWFLTVDLTAGFQILVSVAPVSAFTNGATVTPTRVTGISSIGFGGVAYNGNNIQLSSKITSTVPADRPVLLCDQSAAWASTFHYDIPALLVGVNPLNQWRIRVSSYSWGAYGQSGAGTYMVFTLTYDPVTKNAVLEPEWRDQSWLSFPNGVATFGGPIYSVDYNADGSSHPTNSCPSYCYVPGTVFTYRQAQGSDVMLLAKGEYSNAPTLYDWLKKGTYQHLITYNLAMEPNYGSPAGSDLTGGQFIARNKLMFNAKGRDVAGNYAMGPAVTAINGLANYDYNSLANGPMKGYKPEHDRSFLKDLGLTSPESYAAGVTEVVAGTNVFYSTLRLYSTRLTGRRSLDGNFQSLAGDTSVTSLTMLNATQNALAAAGVSNVLTYMYDLVVPHQLAAVCPAFMVVSYMTAANVSGFFVAAVTLVYDGDRITRVVTDSVSPKVQMSTQATGVSYTPTAVPGLGGWALWQNGDDILIGGTGIAYYATAGGAPSVAMRFRYNSSTKQWNWGANMGAMSFHVNAAWRGFTAHPDHGLMLLMGSQESTDTGTKLVGVPVGKTAVAFDAFALGAVSTWRVLVSQDVAEGWALYFTEPTPVLMNGRYYVMPPAEFDLQMIEANPANKVFYVFAVQVGQTVQYAVTTEKATESINRMYLGYVATGASSIETLALEKVTKLGNVRLSQVARGNAIAVTAGPPATPATLPWS